MHGCMMRLKSVQSEVDVDASEQPSHSPGAAHAPHGRRSLGDHQSGWVRNGTWIERVSERGRIIRTSLACGMQAGTGA